MTRGPDPSRHLSRYEGEDPRTSLENPRLAHKPVDTDTPPVLIGRNERSLYEASLDEMPPNARRQIGLASTACPDHVRLRCHQLGERVDRAEHVTVGNVPEDAADQDEVRRREVFIARSQTGVRLQDLDSRKSPIMAPLLGYPRQDWVQLDQPSPQPKARAGTGQHTQDIITLTGAETDHCLLTLAPGDERLDQLLLDCRQAPTQI